MVNLTNIKMGTPKDQIGLVAKKSLPWHMTHLSQVLTLITQTTLDSGELGQLIPSILIDLTQAITMVQSKNGKKPNTLQVFYTLTMKQMLARSSD